jgi:hypothetical protein
MHKNFSKNSLIERLLTGSKRKIDDDVLRKATEEKPDLYLRELAKKFNCSVAAVHKRLIQLKITLKKDLHLLRKI